MDRVSRIAAHLAPAVGENVSRDAVAGTSSDLGCHLSMCSAVHGGASPPGQLGLVTLQVGGSVSANPTSAASNVDKFNVAVLGAAGGIGQPLSLLLKL